jgi:hypothetical protein
MDPDESAGQHDMAMTHDSVPPSVDVLGVPPGYEQVKCFQFPLSAAPKSFFNERKAIRAQRIDQSHKLSGILTSLALSSRVAGRIDD